MSTAGAPIPSISVPSIHTAIPIPLVVEPSTTTTDSSQISIHTPDIKDTPTTPKTLTSRPRLGFRKSSGTMIVPHDHPDIELKGESFPPNDARAMSPKRSSAETGRMIIGSRLAIQRYVRTPTTNIRPIFSQK